MNTIIIRQIFYVLMIGFILSEIGSILLKKKAERNARTILEDKSKTK